MFIELKEIMFKWFKYNYDNNDFSNREYQWKHKNYQKKNRKSIAEKCNNWNSEFTRQAQQQIQDIRGRVSKLEDRPIKITHPEEQKGKWILKNEQSQSH